MKRLGPVKARKLERALRDLGFELRRSSGSHRVYVHPLTHRRTTVAFHAGSDDVPKGTVKAILDDIGVDWHDFAKLL